MDNWSLVRTFVHWRALMKLAKCLGLICSRLFWNRFVFYRSVCFNNVHHLYRCFLNIFNIFYLKKNDRMWKKFVTNLVEHMPITSIRRKMEHDEELKKLAVSDEHLHISNEQKATGKDRDLELFSHDLFKYLLYRRLGLTEYCSLEKSLEKQTSNFHPHIGISILCCSYCMQRHLFSYFTRSKLEIQDLDSLACYFTHTVMSLLSINENNVFRKLIVLACVTLELTVFCYLQGNRNLINYAEKLYFLALQCYFKEDFYNNGGWAAWKDLVSDDVKFYEENKCEIPVKGTQMVIVNGWLKIFDRWIVQYALKTSCNNTESALVGNESNKQPDITQNFKNATSDTTYASENVSEDGLFIEDKYKCLLKKDCPETKKVEHLSNCLILDLIEVISRNKDSAYEHIYQIIENNTCVKELMRYCIFPKLIIRLKRSEIKLRNTDILQFMKLLLQENASMAMYCTSLVDKMYEELDEMKSVVLNETEKNNDKTAENPDRQETIFNTESFDCSSPTKEHNSPNREHKNLLDSFLLKIKPLDKSCTSSVSQICEILLDEPKAEILMKSYPFRTLMKMTVNRPENRWEDEWILSVIQLLINNSQTKDCVCMYQSTVDDSRKTEYPSNKISVVCANPQLIKFVPYNVITTANEPSVSKSDGINTIPIPDDDPNNEHVKTLHQNVHSSNVCNRSFNPVAEKLPQVKNQD